MKQGIFHFLMHTGAQLLFRNKIVCVCVGAELQMAETIHNKIRVFNLSSGLNTICTGFALFLNRALTFH